MGLGMWTDLLQGKGREFLEQTVFLDSLPRCRWFGGKSRSIHNVLIQDWILPYETSDWIWLILRIDFREGGPEIYSLPLTQAQLSSSAAQNMRMQNPSAILAEVGIAEGQALNLQPVILYEAAFDPDFRSRILECITSRSTWQGHLGTLQGHGLPDLFLEPLSEVQKTSHVLKVEQSNTALIYPGRIFFKILRRLEAGEHPELEILRFLNEKTTFRHAPPLLGWLEYTIVGQPAYIFGIAEGLVPHQQGAWDFALASANRYIDSLLIHRTHLEAMPKSEAILPLEFARLLGRRTAELHHALASHPEHPGFSVEFYSPQDKALWLQNLKVKVARVLDDLGKVLPTHSEESAELGRAVLNSRVRILEAIAELENDPIEIPKTRVHGDFHLGQVLCTDHDVVILDFEGEPARSLLERTGLRSPWCDVAGMIRSFDYAIHSAWPGGRINGATEDKDLFLVLEPWVELWPKQLAAAFLEAYSKTLGNSASFPMTQQREVLLRTFLLEKAVYELEYELNNRPTWTHIPMLGILNLLST